MFRIGVHYFFNDGLFVFGCELFVSCLIEAVFILLTEFCFSLYDILLLENITINNTELLSSGILCNSVEFVNIGCIDSDTSFLNLESVLVPVLREGGFSFIDCLVLRLFLLLCVVFLFEDSEFCN